MLNKGFVYFFLLCFIACKTNSRTIKPISFKEKGYAYKTQEFDSLNVDCQSVALMTKEDNPFFSNDCHAGIFGRKVTYRNISGLDLSTSGTISIKSCIDTSGHVIYSELIKEETTIRSEKVLTKTLKASLGYKFEPDNTAHCLQCGKLIFRLDINTHGFPNKGMD